MCFSTEASFTASAILLITGVASIKKAKAPSQLFFAGIPIIFSIQQFTEGILWLSIKNPVYSEWQEPATHVFLAFAQGIWPLWVPLSFFLLEKEKMQKKVLGALVISGTFLSVYLTYCLLNYDVRSRISGHHIHYDLLFPDYLGRTSSLLYFLAIVFSPFISSVKRSTLLGILNLTSFLISLLFFHDNLISVWCFMAAGISAVVLAAMHSLNSKNQSMPFAAAR